MIDSSSTPTAFVSSIRMLAERGGSVPPGWRYVYYETLHRLRAADCPGRGTLKLSGPFVGEEALTIIATGSDVKVDGMLRRLERQSTFTCQACGRVGKARDLGNKIEVLCSSCAAPRMLQFELKKLIENLAASVNSERPVIVSYSQNPIPLRPVVPASVWWPVRTGSGTDETCCTTHDALRRHTNRFEQVQAALDSQLCDQDYY